MIYHFVVLSDEVDNFRREIDIDAEATFQELNDLLLKTCAYKKDLMTSFFVCDEFWEKKKEITAVDMHDDPEKEPAPLMEHTHLSDIISEKDAKNKLNLLFEFDIMCERYLYMQLKEVRDHEHLLQPVITLEKGKAPKQEGDIDTMFKDLDTSDMYGDDSFNDDELDLDGYQDLEDIESGGY
ncbi:MAG: hypothetical protein IKH58_14490 [Bacteroidales bacterium]|jgi:hypothetical protein|nr:hypothetical protein [Bacteroidales bacterium]